MSDILYIEDDRHIGRLVQVTLGSKGHEVELVTDGLEGLERLERAPRPSLVILDIMLPGIDGLSILSFMRKKPELADVPVLVLTARSTDVDLGGHETAGHTESMSKPFDIEELIATVERLRSLN